MFRYFKDLIRCFRHFFFTAMLFVYGRILSQRLVNTVASDKVLYKLVSKFIKYHMVTCYFLYIAGMHKRLGSMCFLNIFMFAPKVYPLTDAYKSSSFVYNILNFFYSFCNAYMLFLGVQNIHSPYCYPLNKSQFLHF